MKQALALIMTTVYSRHGCSRPALLPAPTAYFALCSSRKYFAPAAPRTNAVLSGAFHSLRSPQTRTKNTLMNKRKVWYKI